MSELKPSPNSTSKDQPITSSSSSPECSSASTTTPGLKCMKRKLFPSPTDSNSDDDVTPLSTPFKRKCPDTSVDNTSLSLSDSRIIKTSCQSSTVTTLHSTPARVSASHNVPLSERQQLALILKMSEENPQPDVSPKSTSPCPSQQQLKRTPLDKKINKRNERGETILHLVAIKGDTKLTKKYIKAGADVNAQDFAGWTALHEACNHGFIDVAKQLLKAGANVNAQGLDNDTPLHDASCNGHSALVTLLLKHGANPLQVNKSGKSSVDVAASEEIVQLLKKEIVSSTSDCSSVDDNRSPTSPESVSSTRDDDPQTSLDDFSSRGPSNIGPRVEVTTTDSFKKRSVAKSPDSKSHSPRLFLKFQHLKFKDGPPCESAEAIAKKDTNAYKNYSVTLETADRTDDCFSPFNSGSSNASDSYESKLDINRRLKAVDASLTEQENLLTKERDSHFFTSRDSSYSTASMTSQITSAQFTSLPEPTYSRSYESYPMVTSDSSDTTIPVNQSVNRHFPDSRSAPSYHSSASYMAVSASYLESRDVHYSTSQVPENKISMAMSVNVPHVSQSVISASVPPSILCEHTGEQLPLDNATSNAFTHLNQENLIDSYTDEHITTYKQSDLDLENRNSLKVPPLRIIMPTKSSIMPQSSGKLNYSITNSSLPYVVNSANAESEPTSSSLFSLEPSMSIGFVPSISEAMGVSQSIGDDVASSSTDLVKFPMITAAAAESTSADDSKPVSENEASEGSDQREDKDERRITRSLRSHMTQLQQKERDKDKQGSDSNDANSDSIKNSRPDDPSMDDQPITDVPPRKRKLRPKPEPTTSEILPPNPMSLYELPPNPYEIFLSRKRSLTSRQENLMIVPPTEPKNFKDYLMVSCRYVLQGNTASRLAVPMLSPPNSITGAMRDLFTIQEKARYKLRLQHLVEREKLTLASEQEILRVHGRAARAMANQSIPLSVCTVLKDQELYPSTDFEQDFDERDKNIRSRYNGRQFMSWLQDVADKYDKLKELLILRHHHEAESLYAVQKMDWEWKLKELGICEHNATPCIDDLHVPMVQVSDD